MFTVGARSLNAKTSAERIRTAGRPSGRRDDVRQQRGSVFFEQSRTAALLELFQNCGLCRMFDLVHIPAAAARGRLPQLETLTKKAVDAS